MQRFEKIPKDFLSEGRKGEKPNNCIYYGFYIDYPLSPSYAVTSDRGFQRSIESPKFVLRGPSGAFPRGARRFLFQSRGHTKSILERKTARHRNFRSPRRAAPFRTKKKQLL